MRQELKDTITVGQYLKMIDAIFFSGRPLDKVTNKLMAIALGVEETVIEAQDQKYKDILLNSVTETLNYLAGIKPYKLNFIETKGKVYQVEFNGNHLTPAQLDEYDKLFTPGVRILMNGAKIIGLLCVAVKENGKWNPVTDYEKVFEDMESARAKDFIEIAKYAFLPKVTAADLIDTDDGLLLTPVINNKP